MRVPFEVLLGLYYVAGGCLLVIRAWQHPDGVLRRIAGKHRVPRGVERAMEKTFLFRVWTGPIAVVPLAHRFSKVGFTVVAQGTEHVYVRAQGVTITVAANSLGARLRERYGTDWGIKPVYWSPLPGDENATPGPVVR